MTPQEALDAIGRLCDEREHGPGPGWVAVDEVRAVLAEPGPAVPTHDIDREGAWQDWKAREARYRDSSMTDLRQAFEAGWDAAATVRPSAPVSDTRTGGVA